MADATTDNRPPNTVLRQFERLELLKKKLIKMGHLNGDATPAQVIDCVRTLIPPDVFSK